MKAIFDLDGIIYAAGFAGEKRSIEVLQESTGKIKTFKNRTEFWGKKSADGISKAGWLFDLNNQRAENNLRPLLQSEFIITDVQEAEPLENILHTVKVMINKVLMELNCDEYVGFIGKGDSFRLERSTLMQYKGNREDALRPVLKDEITKYLIKHQNAIQVEGLEADDWVIIEACKDPDNSIVISHDKDSLGCPVKSYNPSKPELGVQDGRCFGEIYPIYKDGTGTVKDIKGIGRKFFYYQVAYGDKVDNYFANGATDREWGQVAAYNALKDTKNDLEALQALKEVYMSLYPQPKEITGWRGDKIVVDWQYVLNEIWDMARMMRSEDDFVKATDVLKKYKLI